MATEVAVWNIASNLCSACLDGRYENCYCDDDEKLKCDASCESSDDGCGADIEDEKMSRHRLKNKRHIIQDEYISDDEFQNNEDDRPLPPSTTDWNSINSVLETKFNDYGEDEGDGNEGDGLTKRLSNNVNMQMVFVEDEVESDKASDPDVEVYYDDNFEDRRPAHSGSFGELSYTGGRDIDSRDSGYVTTDVMDVAIERVTETKNRRRGSCTETVEESTRVLASLKLHEEHEERVQNELLEQKKKESEFIEDIHQKNVDELRTMKEYLQVHIARINVELLEQLEIRDSLYSHHEALLMDADDIAKANERNKMTSPSVPMLASASTNEKAKGNNRNNKNSKNNDNDKTTSKDDSSYTNDTNNNDLQNNTKIPTDNENDHSNTESPSKSAKRRSFWWR